MNPEAANDHVAYARSRLAVLERHEARLLALARESATIFARVQPPQLETQPWRKAAARRLLPFGDYSEIPKNVSACARKPRIHLRHYLRHCGFVNRNPLTTGLTRISLNNGRRFIAVCGALRNPLKRLKLES